MWLLVLALVCVKICENFSSPELDLDSFLFSVSFIPDNVARIWFLGGFCSPRAVSFNWNNVPFYLQLIILLSGDIHLNPGPESVE